LGLIKIKTKKFNGFYSALEIPWLEYILSTIEFFFEQTTPVKSRIDNVKINNSGIDLIIGTSDRGLLLLENGILYQIVNAKGVYGITFKNERWYFFHKTKYHGRICSVNLKTMDFKVHLYGLSIGIHQIDFVDDILFVVDTYKNRILKFSNIDNRLNSYWRTDVEKFYPNGKLKKGRDSSNYNHFNSILYKDDFFYLMAHNETYKTKRKSEIYKLDKKFNVVSSEVINASNAHNICFDDKYMYFCDSIGKALSAQKDSGENKRVDLEGFTRGVAINRSTIVCGSSKFEIERAKRNESTSTIYFLDKMLKVNDEFSLENTQINEIRITNGVDITLSNKR